MKDCYSVDIGDLVYKNNREYIVIGVYFDFGGIFKVLQCVKTTNGNSCASFRRVYNFEAKEVKYTA